MINRIIDANHLGPATLKLLALWRLYTDANKPVQEYRLRGKLKMIQPNDHWYGHLMSLFNMNHLGMIPFQEFARMQGSEIYVHSLSHRESSDIDGDFTHVWIEYDTEKYFAQVHFFRKFPDRITSWLRKKRCDVDDQEMLSLAFVQVHELKRRQSPHSGIHYALLPRDVRFPRFRVVLISGIKTKVISYINPQINLRVIAEYQHEYAILSDAQ